MKVSDIFSMGGGGCDHGDGDHGHRGYSSYGDHDHDRFDGGHRNKGYTSHHGRFSDGHRDGLLGLGIYL